MKIYKSPHPDIDLPQLDILSFLFDSDHCQAQEDTKIHVEAANPTNSITKSQARHLTRRLAYIFRHEYNIGHAGPGRDHILTCLYGSPFAPVLFYGIVAAGGIFCGANTEYKPSEIAHQIKDSKTTLLICSPDCQDRITSAAKQTGIPSSNILLVDSSTPGPENWKLIRLFDNVDLLSRHAGSTLAYPRITDPNTLRNTATCLLYSSGTTGLPKGVRIPHSALVANNVCTMAVARRYQASSTTPSPKTKPPFRFDTIAHLPMANIAGISLYATNPFYMGGTTYWMHHYDFAQFIVHHKQFRPAYQFSVPPIWLRIAKSELVTDHFDHLQVAVTGSAPIGPETIASVRQKLGGKIGGCDMAQTWGITEATGVVTASEWREYRESGRWSVGELCPNVRARVVDEDENDVDIGSAGELWISGPILAQGYHERPEATAESFVEPGATVGDMDRWYKTGDIGTIDDRGSISIIDRKKELIKYKGAQVAPAELEAVLTSNPEIADAAVIGIWDAEQQTEVPRGYAVRRAGSHVSEKDVQNYVAARVAPYKQLRGGIFFLEEIPKSASGKILRKELRVKASQVGKAKL
ncbi:hypothetical protein PMZ80_001154 [Knufia obscura]|uniref:Acetyl-CoA synthetase-like protein n=1 Tax=Knufia obscura TaxID=1635080 RepID=A0ABR0S2D5_9EURO|nr:hypothetical protein PMZ80_001154 [Knufia obscura]